MRTVNTARNTAAPHRRRRQVCRDCRCGRFEPSGEINAEIFRIMMLGWGIAGFVSFLIAMDYSYLFIRPGYGYLDIKHN